jgi:hypothetical protein
VGQECFVAGIWSSWDFDVKLCFVRSSYDFPLGNYAFRCFRVVSVWFLCVFTRFPTETGAKTALIVIYIIAGFPSDFDIVGVYKSN